MGRASSVATTQIQWWNVSRPREAPLSDLAQLSPSPLQRNHRPACDTLDLCKFIRDMVYGIQATGDTILTDIARVVDSEGRHRNVENRLSRNLEPI